MKKIFTLAVMAMIAIGAMAEDYNERTVKTYEDNLAVTVAGVGPFSQKATITIAEQAEEGKYTIQLNQFSFMDQLVGDVTMTDVQGDDDSEGFTNYATTQTATITNGEEDGIMGMLGGKIDVTVKEGTRSKGDKFYAVITLVVPGVGNVDAVFGDNNFGGNVDGIAASTASANAKVAAIYTLGGQRVNTMVRGINILKMTDGRTVKVVNK